jgi:hypothetical protein
MNSYAECLAETLHEKKHVPTSETRLDYFRTASLEEILEATETQIDHCVQALKKKGITLKKAELACDWHDQTYYGSLHTEGVVGTKPNRGTSYAFCF